MNRSTDIAVIGGGIIGLSVAWQLARSGARVTLFERDQPGCGATRAAAGMLAPLAEGTRAGVDFIRLGLESLDMYESFLDQLRDDSGIAVPLSERGMLRVALDEREANELVATVEWQQQFGLPLQTLTTRELRAFEPLLTDDVHLAICSPREKSVDPRELTRALHAACERRGVTLVRADAKIEGSSVTTRVEQWSAATIVIAAGSWSGFLSDLLPVRPVKGEIIAAVAAPLLRTTLFSHDGYIVPRDGMLLVGATEEEAGFDCTTTSEATDRFTAVATKLLRIESFTVMETTAGLRPGTPDRMPIIGKLGDTNVIAATGHYRNGILLAPLTAKMVADLVLEGAQHPLAAVTAPSRFAAAGALR